MISFDYLGVFYTLGIDIIVGGGDVYLDDSLQYLSVL